jgi:hypothetical protein
MRVVGIDEEEDGGDNDTGVSAVGLADVVVAVVAIVEWVLLAEEDKEGDDDDDDDDFVVEFDIKEEINWYKACEYRRYL